MSKQLGNIFTVDFVNELKNYFNTRVKSVFDEGINDSFGIFAFDFLYWKLDHFLDFDLLWDYDIEWYQSRFLQAIDNNCLPYLSELMNWVNKGKIFSKASLNDVNNFCSSVTKTSTTPYNNENNQEPEWNYQSNTNRNYLLLDAPQLKWIRFDSVKKLIHEISYLLKTIL